ncbi:hypothetical protein B0T20DRAFT_494042 [Sordaria brevicollis]|uniref:NodB homology domain-containing protein n=1 Tax=Sordaria brevicollis TaxID=83679 RepID=A0AAE0NRD3_SORBR|nr:hypothetical protein B0T20DRAFT_494042 [Sordaria brevicollis]
MRWSTLLPVGALVAVGQHQPTQPFLHILQPIPSPPNQHQHQHLTPPSLRRAPPLPTGQILTSCTTPGLVALTFDDGPYIYTAPLLTLLSSFSPPVPATFFVNGANWVSGIDDESGPYPGILRRIVSEGHQLASHTWSHADLSGLSKEERVEEVEKLGDVLERVVGVRPRYIRPPYGSCDDGCLQDLEGMGVRVVGWGVDTRDWENDEETEIWGSVDKFERELGTDPAGESAIVLGHDVHRWTVEVLVGEMVRVARGRGFRLVTVGECLGDGGEGWYF